MQLTQILDGAEKIVREAGFLAKSIRDEGRLVEYKKENGSPVTNADREGESHIQEEFRKLTPTYGFHGEETGYTAGTNAYEWVCDPIDGTRNFIKGGRNYTTTVALRNGARTHGGMIFNPATQECYRSGDGEEPKKNGQRLPKIRVQSLSQAQVSYSVSSKRGDVSTMLEEAVSNGQIGDISPSEGSVAYRLAEVAEGKNHAYVSCHTSPVNIWDIAAGIHLLESNGGKITDEEGNPLSASNKANMFIAAANQEIHSQLLALLQRSRLPAAC